MNVHPTSPSRDDASPKRSLFKPALIAAALIPSAHLMADTTWTGGNGVWSDSGNWSAGVPATSGDTVTFDASGNVTSTIDSSWASAGSVEGLVFSADNFDYILDQGAGVTSLSIGSGGIVSNKTGGDIRLNGTINLAANQEWSNTTAPAGSYISVWGDLTGSGDLTINGNGGAIQFWSGSSSTWTGSMILESGTARINQASQLGRLGSNLTMHGGTQIYAPINLGGTDHFMSTNINFDSSVTADSFTFSITGSSGNLIYDGNWSGTIDGFNRSLRLVNSGSDVRQVLRGDNSGLTWADTLSTNGYGGFHVEHAFVRIESDNALGADNGITTTIGDGDGGADSAGLLTTDGHNVTALISVKSKFAGTAGDVYIGMEGGGAATFSGDVELQSRDTGDIADLHLTADTGSTATFSGSIYNRDNASTLKVTSITAEGGGTIILSGDNTYIADTTVAANTTLLANSATGSATGTGAVIVQADATLGGTGRIAAGAANGITAQNGSIVAPGASIGTLVLDGINTSGPVLTMDAGSTFAFELGAADSSDQIALWNYAAGDLVLNDNIVNFSGAQEGTYTLFEFYSDDGSTMVASGITDGLVIGTGLEGFSYTLNYNSDSITLDVIPEPSSFALLLGLGSMAFIARRRR